MPRFFFHRRVGHALQSDPAGIELPHVDAAYGQAMSRLLNLSGSDELRLDDARIEVADEHGETVLTIAVFEDPEDCPIGI